MTANRRIMVVAASAFVLGFLFLVPVVGYSIPPGLYHCPPVGCNFLRYGSVTYLALGVGGTWRDVSGYSISFANTPGTTISSSSVSYTTA